MEPASLPVHMHEYYNAYFHLWVDSEVKLMYTEWLTAPSALEYQEAAALFIHYLQKYKVEYWFMDSNRLGGLSLEEQRKVIQQLAPAVAASCLRKVARIIFQDADNRVMFDETVTELKNQYQATVEIQQFWTYNEAANWITVIRA
ncbi:hypothetical protein [Adhaeribacter rhizoryzae]|uniref:STAS/SEC14 domain-containing protein n=1 Tax=Adhaeribacter rhizoryzae TaxID=2607907 RepID=A0A5M6CUV9_9BACT|nr:hypothetical protein [Adhaeribacter rhizoryzae]KAA5539037.1 hypothetical protein F0145_25195 [Adhaeribacter rhizoryzae]